MMLAKVKEQDGMMLAKVKVPSIPTSAACCDDVQLINVESSSYTFYNRQLRNRTESSKPQIPLVIYNCQLTHRTASSKHRYLLLFTTVNYFNCVLQTQIPQSSYLQPSITSSDCVLQNTGTSKLFTTVNYFIGLRPPKHRYLHLVIYNRQLLHRTASSFKPLM